MYVHHQWYEYNYKALSGIRNLMVDQLKRFA
jgi:hypothetical protein